MGEMEYTWEKLAVMMRLSNEFMAQISDPRIQISHDIMRRFDEVIVEWNIATRKLMEWKAPATWLDAVKERWFPEWALAKWPVCYRRITLNELIGIKREPMSGYKYRYHIQDDLTWGK